MRECLILVGECLILARESLIIARESLIIDYEVVDPKSGMRFDHRALEFRIGVMAEKAATER
jgi:hypothetical protein